MRLLFETCELAIHGLLLIAQVVPELVDVGAPLLRRGLLLKAGHPVHAANLPVAPWEGAVGEGRVRMLRRRHPLVEVDHQAIGPFPIELANGRVLVLEHHVGVEQLLPDARLGNGLCSLWLFLFLAL